METPELASSGPAVADGVEAGAHQVGFWDHVSGRHAVLPLAGVLDGRSLEADLGAAIGDAGLPPDLPLGPLHGQEHHLARELGSSHYETELLAPMS